MKFITLHFLYLLSSFLCVAQNKVGIISKDINVKAGRENNYIYLPPKGLLVPPKMQALVAFETKNIFYRKKIPITEVNGRYIFTFYAPDSTAVLVFAVVNEMKKVLQNNSFTVEKEIIVDNNNEKGYVIYLHDKKDKRFIFSDISLARLMSGFAIYTLQLKSILNANIINMYEKAYIHYPFLRQEGTFIDYLIALYKEKPDKSRPELLKYAIKLSTYNTDESKLINAKRIYEVIKMDTLVYEIEKKILESYPNGSTSESIFWDSLYKKADNDEQSVLLAMDDYIKRFKDSSSVIKDKFYKIIISNMFSAKQFEDVEKYENLVYNKYITYSMYNYWAWRMAGKGLDNPGSDLEWAKIFSGKSMTYFKSLIKSGINMDENGENLNAVLDKITNTYALVLYKLGQFDSAFRYQFAIYKRGKDLLDDAGYERLAVYMEKVYEIKTTRKFIEEQLLNGVNSPIMLKQLQLIYKQLDLSQTEFSQLQSKNDRLARKKNTKFIKARLGSTVANNFLLKNILGEDVSLSLYRNKVVVLDFWATWCAPCKASFPGMQELVNKYKADTGVVFLFIDVWESKDPKETKEIVASYMKDNNYSFNVLFDEKEVVVKDYKIKGIPSKFVIDRKGNVVFISDDANYLDDISLVIDSAKK